MEVVRRRTERKERMYIITATYGRYQDAIKENAGKGKVYDYTSSCNSGTDQA